jgi:hypothetical protein
VNWAGHSLNGRVTKIFDPSSLMEITNQGASNISGDMEQKVGYQLHSVNSMKLCESVQLLPAQPNKRVQDCQGYYPIQQQWLINDMDKSNHCQISHSSNC